MGRKSFLDGHYSRAHWLKLFLNVWLYLLKKIDPNWIDSDYGTIFVKGHDPGLGKLRVVGKFKQNS